MVVVALFRAGGAGAGVAQPLEAKVRVMAVVPLDVHAGTGGDVDFDGLGVDYGHIDKYIQDLRGAKYVSEPSPKLRPNERLDSLSPRQPPAEHVAFTLNANANIKKRTARVFQRRDLSQRDVCIQAPRKFKVISIRQFPNP